MIHFNAVVEPASFNAEVRRRGRDWLKRNPNARRPKPLWAPYLAALDAGYSGLCGYAAMFDPTGGTVDHYFSFKSRRDLAYEWSNYRFASAIMNSIKRDADDSILDPQDVEPGWFEIILPSLQLRCTSRVPSNFRAKAEFTLNRLRLGNGERVIRWRQSWHQMYLEGNLDLEGLRRVAPLIAEAVEKQTHGKQKRVLRPRRI